MVSVNPFSEFYSSCESLLKDTLSEMYPDFSVPPMLLEVPPNLEFGELAASVCFELAKHAKKSPRTLADEIAKKIDEISLPLLKSVSAAGAGYINFRVNSEMFSRLTIESAIKLDADYGYVKTAEPKKVLLEHTSVNPIHPIHIGQARNPMLGDALSRILSKHGHNVSRHYYVDDVGRQSAVIAYGYSKLGKPKPIGKPDRFIGGIYAVTSCIMEIQRLKKAVAKATDLDSQERSKLQKDLAEWTSISAEMQERFPDLFAKLYGQITKDLDPEEQVSVLIRGYESGEDSAKQLLRKVCLLCLEGFKETLESVEIKIDSWDWESDLIWNGDVNRTLEALKNTAYVFEENGVLEFNAEKVAKNLDLKKTLGLNENNENKVHYVKASNPSEIYYFNKRIENNDPRLVQVANLDLNALNIHEINVIEKKETLDPIYEYIFKKESRLAKWFGIYNIPKKTVYEWLELLTNYAEVKITTWDTQEKANHSVAVNLFIYKLRRAIGDFNRKT